MRTRFLKHKNYEMTPERIENFYTLENKVLKYAYEFWKELCDSGINSKYCPVLNKDILPLTCYDRMIEVLESTKANKEDYVSGGFVSTGYRQGCIRIGLDVDSNRCTQKLKRTIRHELIHYFLWTLDYPHNDYDAEFLALAYVFDADPYMRDYCTKPEHLEFFIETYENELLDLPPKVYHICLGEMIGQMNTDNPDEYEENIYEVIENAKAIFIRR